MSGRWLVAGAATALALVAVGCGKKIEAEEREKGAVARSDRPEYEFREARASFLKKETRVAARDIRSAADYIRSEATKATGETKTLMGASERELERLSKDVEGGAVKSIDTLDAAFSRASHALARYHHEMASESWAGREVENTGRHLEAAARELKYSASWAGHEMRSATSAAVRDAQIIGGNLLKGVGWVPEEVGKGIEALGAGIESVGRYVQPAREPMPATTPMPSKK